MKLWNMFVTNLPQWSGCLPNPNPNPNPDPNPNSNSNPNPNPNPNLNPILTNYSILFNVLSH